MVQGGATFVKYLLFFFNLLFVLTGLALIIVGAVVESKASDYFNVLGGKGYTSTAVLLIVVGVIIFLVAFFGCCGAVKENHCMVMTFAVLLFVIFIMELSGGIAAYVYKKDLKNLLHDGMEKSFEKYNSSQDTQTTWHDMQKKLHCCGVDSSLDYENVTGPQPLPPTCCGNGTECRQGDNDTYTGCFQKLFTDLDDNIAIVGGVGVGIAFVQIVGIIFACCLARSIKKQYEVV